MNKKVRKQPPKTENCLHLITYSMTYEEVISYVCGVYNELSVIIANRMKYTGGKYVPECKFKVNMPSTKTANAKDFCFVWMPRAMFYMLIGNDYDGTLIQEQTQRPLELLLGDWTSDSISHSKYIPPLFRMRDGSEIRPKFSEAIVENRVSSEFIEGTLRCINTPEGITEEQMLKMFIPFSRGVLSIVSNQSNRGKYYDIIFGDVDCAYFALYMMRKHTVKGYSKPLIFDHAKKTNSRKSY